MAKDDKFDDSLFQDVPYDAPTDDMDDSLFQDVPYDAPLEEDDLSLEDPDKMGIGEAALTGFGEGTTFGLAPILAGLGGAAMEVGEDVGDVLGLTQDAELREQGFDVPDEEPGLQGLLDAYYKSRDISRQQQEKAFEDQPLAALAGSVGGGIASFGGAAKLASQLGKGGRISQAVSKILPKTESLKDLNTIQKAGIGVREGTKAGGLAGFGSGEAKLAEGELTKAAAETGGTAIGGGLLGGALPVAGAGARKTGEFLKDLPLLESLGLGFKAGRKGIDIGDEQQVIDFISGVSDDVRTSISKNFSGASKQQLLNEADEIGVRVAAGEPIEDVINKIKTEGGFGKKAQKELGQFVEDLKGLSQNYDPALQKALSGVEKQAAKKAMNIARKGGQVEMRTDLDESFDELVPMPEKQGRVIGVEDKFRTPTKTPGKFREGKSLSTASILEGEVPLKQYDLQNMKLSELDEVIRKIGQRGFEGDDAAVPFARELYGRLRQASNEALESSSLPERNRKLKSMFDALESLDVDPKKFFSKQETVQDEVQKKIFQKITSGSLAGDLDMRNFLKYMGRADERLTEELKDKTSFAKDLGKFIQQSEGEGSVSLQAAAGPVQKVLAKTGGLAGSGIRTATDAKSAIFKRMGNMTPNEVLEFGIQLSELYGNKAKPFVNALSKAAKADGQRRSALMYGIYQQPAFRKMLEDVGRTTIGEEAEEEIELEPSDEVGIPENSDNGLSEFGFTPGRTPQGVTEIDDEMMAGMEGNETRGYIPTRNGQAIGQSGVTIAGGLDLGQRQSLDDLDLPEELKDKFQPYLGLKREDAQRALAENPLEISPKETDIVNRAVKDAYFQQTASEFEQRTGRDINELPAPIQTVLYSLKYNTGSIGPKTAQLAAEGNYEELINEVRNWHGSANVDPGITNRRSKEAEYLEKQLQELRKIRENLR